MEEKASARVPEEAGTPQQAGRGRQGCLQRPSCSKDIAEAHALQVCAHTPKRPRTPCMSGAGSLYRDFYFPSCSDKFKGVKARENITCSSHRGCMFLSLKNQRFAFSNCNFHSGGLRYMVKFPHIFTMVASGSTILGKFRECQARTKSGLQEKAFQKAFKPFTRWRRKITTTTTTSDSSRSFIYF